MEIPSFKKGKKYNLEVNQKISSSPDSLENEHLIKRSIPKLHETQREHSASHTEMCYLHSAAEVRHGIENKNVGTSQNHKFTSLNFHFAKNNH